MKMKSTKAQLLVTLAAVLVGAAVFAARGLPPAMSWNDAWLYANVDQLQQHIRWGARARETYSLVGSVQRYEMVHVDIDTGAVYSRDYREKVVFLRDLNPSFAVILERVEVLRGEPPLNSNNTFAFVIHSPTEFFASSVGLSSDKCIGKRFKFTFFEMVDEQGAPAGLDVVFEFVM